MSVPPIGSSQFSFSSNSSMDLAKIYVNQLNACMSSSPPNEQSYNDIKAQLNSLIPSLPAPFNEFIQHGILYQCDAYFNSGNPLFACDTNQDIQQGICCSLTSVFSLFANVPAPFPQIAPSQLGALQADLEQFKNDMMANNQQACSADASNLNSLAGQLPEPYSALITSLVIQYPNYFSPPDHNANFYLGMATGVLNTVNYLTAPDYSHLGRVWGDFEESIHVYGDYESATQDAKAINPNVNAAIFVFNQLYDVTDSTNPIQPGPWALVTPPDVNTPGSPGPQDWLHNLTVFLSEARQGGSPNMPPASVFQGLSPDDQAIINGFLDGTGPFAISGNGENMKNNWTIEDGYGKAGCDYYRGFYTDGTFQKLTQATVNLVNAFLKTQ
jgi:hypothetical protein